MNGRWATLHEKVRIKHFHKLKKEREALETLKPMRRDIEIHRKIKPEVNEQAEIYAKKEKN